MIGQVAACSTVPRSGGRRGGARSPSGGAAWPTIDQVDPVIRDLAEGRRDLVARPLPDTPAGPDADLHLVIDTPGRDGATW